VILHLACISSISDCCQINYLGPLILHATYATCDTPCSMHEFLFLIVVKLIVWVDATSDTTCNLHDFFLFQIAVKLIVGVD
jgi:hypothetical protein